MKHIIILILFIIITYEYYLQAAITLIKNERGLSYFGFKLAFHGCRTTLTRGQEHSILHSINQSAKEKTWLSDHN